MGWCVAQIKPEPKSCERAIINLTRQNYQVLHPTYAVRRVVRNRLRTETKSLFTNYLFVHIDLDAGQRWVPASNSFGVSRLLLRKSFDGGYDEPQWLSPDFIENLKTCSDPDTSNPGCRCLKVGTTIRILRGPFSGHHAIVEWSNEQRCRLLLHLLNRDVPLTLAVEDVAAIDP